MVVTLLHEMQLLISGPVQVKQAALQLSQVVMFGYVKEGQIERH